MYLNLFIKMILLNVEWLYMDSLNMSHCPSVIVGLNLASGHFIFSFATCWHLSATLHMSLKWITHKRKDEIITGWDMYILCVPFYQHICD